MDRKAIESDGAKVNCDHCAFEKKVDHINEYLNKQCPYCDSPDILITDEDVKLFEEMMKLASLMNELHGPVTDDESQRVKFSIKVTDGAVKSISKEEPE